MVSGGVRRTPVLVAASGAAWEADAVRLLERAPDIVLHRRSVDLADLLASAATGLARCAVVADSLDGLDADAVAHLGRAGVRVIAVLSAAGSQPPERLARIGVARWVTVADLEELCAAVREVSSEGGEPATGAGLDDSTEPPYPTERGRLTVVWGPTGAPGRTTVATALAAESAARGRATLLVDADPYGGAVAQHLGILDEVSGLLAAVRRANSGQLDVTALNEAARALDGGLRVLTGLPRADRWAEVRPAAFAEILDRAQQLVEMVVLDVGFSLEDSSPDPFAAAPRRNETTLAALDR
nr:hypothetical protein [Nocardioidaceae bacterium]